MTNLLYYPTFEMQNINWLKYAILYIDKFSPIIPSDGREKLSDTYKKISENSDLFEFVTPSYDEGENTFIKVRGEIQKILNNPSDYRRILGDNITMRMKAPALRTFEIYEKKFCLKFQNYCISEGLGERSENGLLVSEIFANIYMTLLAQELSYIRNVSPITDNPALNRYGIFTQTIKPEIQNENDLFECVINQKVPDLNNISFDKLLKFRNKNDAFLREFRMEINTFLDKIGKDGDASKFIQNYNKLHKEYQDLIISLGFGIGVVAISSWILFDKTFTETPEILKLLTKGTGLIASSGYAFSKKWKANKSKRYCRRYLTSLETLNR